MKTPRSSRSRALTAVALALSSLLALSAGGDGAEARPATGQFTLVYNVNNGGYVDVCGCKQKKVRNGSLTRRSSFIKQLRSTGRTLLLLDGGSTLFSVMDAPHTVQRDEAIRKAALIVEAYDHIGYRAMAVGVSDIAMGLDTLKELLAKAKFDALSANFRDAATKKLIFKPHEVYTVNGVRVGVIGLTLETMGSAYLAKAAPGTELSDPIEAARESVAALRGRVDLIVALSHIKQESNYRLVRELTEIGVVVDPFIEYQNHRTWIKKEEWLGVLDETLFLRSDGQGARLGVLDIWLDRPGAKLRHRYLKEQLEEAARSGTATPEQQAELAVYEKRNLYTFERVSISPHHLEDPEIDRLVQAWKKGIDPSAVALRGKELPMRDVFATASKCRPCHQAQFDFWADTGHAHALESLKKTGDEHRYDCVGCHALGYGTAFLDTTRIGDWANVQCESCHGANPGHLSEPEKHRYAKVAEETCLACHNEEHTLKDFHFLSMRRKTACPKG